MFKYIFLFFILSIPILLNSVLAVTAGGGSISFNGAISDTTCTINGGNSANFTILLDPISISDAGTNANTVIQKNQKQFSFTFSDCAIMPTSGTNLKISFSPSSNISSSGLYLVNDTVNENDPTKAINVGFSLSKVATPTIAIQLKTPFDTELRGSLVDGNNETLTLIASYYKTNNARAKAGVLHSNVIYTVTYL
ncbi:fimbrial protein [Providencia burhodogranariea]|uniref:Fimbrial protein n=1 Tax=Providencia burhodogranariea DSM 19968 TaxID=1141662 RepID=K8WVN1_9GAMM|nr:fimbrial protein [Providencia burhodogranariea]EKT64658.1 fimbrial protein [Providencia burhodogranariea DSM 19968]